MLRFAFIVGLFGLACAGVTAALAAVGAPIAATAAVYIALFASVFLSFVPAILGHPARTASGGEVSVAWRAVLGSAARWTVVLAAASLLALVTTLVAFPLGEGFSVTWSSLSGRPDRQLTLACFFAVFHAAAVMIASSGMRYWTAVVPAAPASAGPGLTSAARAAYALRLRAPRSFEYRVADHSSSWLIALEIAVALIVWFQGKAFVSGWPGSLRHALLAVFLLPLAHALFKLFGSVTFALEGRELVVRHFPFFFRNRRIRVSDIKGIQVNPEYDSEGNQSHYSLIVIGLGLEPRRIVHHVPDYEQAAELAQRIDATIESARAE